MVWGEKTEHVCGVDAFSLSASLSVSLSPVVCGNTGAHTHCKGLCAFNMNQAPYIMSLGAHRIIIIVMIRGSVSVQAGLMK